MQWLSCQNAQPLLVGKDLFLEAIRQKQDAYSLKQVKLEIPQGKKDGEGWKRYNNILPWALRKPPAQPNKHKLTPNLQKGKNNKEPQYQQQEEITICSYC